ncbi:MAG TPA: tRNA uridine-5-carboxymethylaminomethyl(34) synthesis GTPase MnmE [Vicinamibacterales bacterium]|jgi:tRNA modification GTPase|nr:tRNA uridine-5-carboxymethylaminomethyl(34) synthesis GTPase MnmE [Vicinamibacterales bacterium]
MFSPDDTIVAIATPPGRGGLGVVRLSGPCSRVIAGVLLDPGTALAPRHATFTRVRGVDDVIATLFVAPHSYTGQDVLEISAHGSPAVLRAIVEAAVAGGARLARPGEFTLRAFLNGRLDLVQSEAVADLIEAATPLQARTAFDQLEGTLTRRIGGINDVLFDLIARLEASLDFPDEGYHFIEPTTLAQAIGAVRAQVETLLHDGRRGRLIREGAQVVIAGRTNVGKSSVFNNLVGSSRAIVTELPGTTRDLLTERMDLNGVLVTIVDTAGVRDTGDLVEREGVERARQAAGVADVVLLVLDRSKDMTAEDARLLAATDGRARVVALNKCDLPASWNGPPKYGGQTVLVSAVTGEGMDALRAAIVEELGGGEEWRDAPAISNVRHIALLEEARESLKRAEQASSTGGTPEEFVLVDLQHARAAFEEITGTRTTDDLLEHIFERFCIGK